MRFLAAGAVLTLGATSIAACGSGGSGGGGAAGVATSLQVAATSVSHRLTLDPSKNYGDKYADGLLPVGDGKYQTTGAKKGSVFVCSQYAQSLQQGGGGAQARGPWFTHNNTEYDATEKVHVQGAVSWTSVHSFTVEGGKRVVRTNDLPPSPTGTFPIASSDPAYAYDRNPNTITAQNITLDLTAKPVYGAPRCIGGEVGVMTDGIMLFNAFDAGGRDAGAWEVQDSCEGHPMMAGVYHFHTLTSCIKNISVHHVIGWAFDGFPITGPDVKGSGDVLTTSDLDACHGITSKVTIDGKSVTTYHYVMTQDFPYSVSCFRATPVTTGPVPAM